MSSDVCNNVTTSLSTSDDVAHSLAYVRVRVLKAIYIVIGTVGVVDNLLVIVVFVCSSRSQKRYVFSLEKFKRHFLCGITLLCAL